MGIIINDDKNAADLLNSYFVSVFTNENLNDIPKPEYIFRENDDFVVLDSIEIDEHVVYKKLSELNVNKCAGPDDIHPKLLHELRAE